MNKPQRIIAGIFIVMMVLMCGCLGNERKYTCEEIINSIYEHKQCFLLQDNLIVIAEYTTTELPLNLKDGETWCIPYLVENVHYAKNSLILSGDTVLREIDCPTKEETTTLKEETGLHNPHWLNETTTTTTTLPKFSNIVELTTWVVRENDTCDNINIPRANVYFIKSPDKIKVDKLKMCFPHSELYGIIDDYNDTNRVDNFVELGLNIFFNNLDEITVSQYRVLSDYAKSKGVKVAENSYVAYSNYSEGKWSKTTTTTTTLFPYLINGCRNVPPYGQLMYVYGGRCGAAPIFDEENITDLANDWSTNDNLTYFRRYSNGIVYFNTTSHHGWINNEILTTTTSEKWLVTTTLNQRCTESCECVQSCEWTGELVADVPIVYNCSTKGIDEIKDEMTTTTTTTLKNCEKVYYGKIFANSSSKEWEGEFSITVCNDETEYTNVFTIYRLENATQ